MNGYKEDLAYIHDVGFGDFAKQAAPNLLEIFRRHKIENGLVVDLGCGSGIWAQELIKAGYGVLGVDISAAMIKLARKRAPQARFVHSSFLQMNLPPCVAVTAIGECFNYLFDAQNTQPALINFFSRVHKALRPNGVFVFDIAEPGQVSASRPGRRHAEGKDWAIQLEVAEDKKANRLTRHMTIFRRAGKLYRRAEEIHHSRLYKGSELAKELRRIGFKVRLQHGYGDFRFTRPATALVAWKP